MKLRSLIVAVAALSAVFSTSAHASQVNFTGSNVDMDHVAIGQYGTIFSPVSLDFNAPPNDGYSGIAHGYLPTNAVIKFSYVFSGFAGGVLKSYSSYDYNQAGHHYTGSSAASSASGAVNNGYKDGSATYSQVFATANLTAPTSGKTLIANYSGQFEQFSSTIFALLSSAPPGSVGLTYTVLQLPLPASLQLMLLAIGGLFAYAQISNKRKLA